MSDAPAAAAVGTVRPAPATGPDLPRRRRLVTRRIVLVIAAALALLCLRQAVETRAPLLADGAAAPGGATVLRLPPAGTLRALAIDIDVNGEAASLRIGEGEAIVLDGRARWCSALPGPALRCHVPAAQAPDRWLAVAIAPVTPGIPVKIAARVLRIQRGAHHEAATVAVLAGVVLAFAPLLWLLHDRVVVTQWLIAALGAGILLYVQPLATLALLAFLLAMFTLGRRMQKGRQRNRSLLAGLVAVAVAVLFAAKYAGDLVYGVFAAYGGPTLALPLGMSYFIIRLIDTLLRWYRQELPALGLREFLCFQLFPPTIPAGPIETVDRFHDRRLARIGRADIAYGAARMLVGLGKKVLVADALIATTLFDPDGGLYLRVALDPQHARPLDAFAFAAFSFLFAYVDFSAYSDLAIGLGRLFGYEIRENFDWPILARNLQQFWRRWHMSLSGWVFRNLHFQLVVATRSTYAPLVLAMLAIAMWHDATLVWFLWGLHHAAALAVLDWRAQRRRRAPGAGRRWTAPLAALLTLFHVSVGYSLVSVSDLGTAVQLYWRSWAAPLLETLSALG